MILENTIKQASQLLKNHNINSHELDAEIILSDIMGVTKEFLTVNNHINISKNIIKPVPKVKRCFLRKYLTRRFSILNHPTPFFHLKHPLVLIFLRSLL